MVTRGFLEVVVGRVVVVIRGFLEVVCVVVLGAGGLVVEGSGGQGQSAMSGMVGPLTQLSQLQQHSNDWRALAGTEIRTW